MDQEMSAFKKAAIERTGAPLSIGQELSNGGIVLKFNYRQHRGGEAVGEHGIVLCLLPHNPYDPFVVWRYVKEEVTNGDFRNGDIVRVSKDEISGTRVVCMHGDYVQSLDEAMKIFQERTERGI